MPQHPRRHSSRLSQVHEGALDVAFTAGQRVMTIDGIPGLVLFASAAFSPGITEYQVVLDGGLGQGTYAASQLRPVPADYRAGHEVPRSLLPAGVTAGLEADAELHTADLDYPEMGTVLSDRPDPGSLITIIGRRAAAHWDDLAGGDDPDRWDDTEVSMPWHDSPAMDPPGPEVHRGIALQLPEHVHRIVHDESRPDYERGLALARHLLTTPHPMPSRGQGLGFNWTDDPEVAKASAERESGIGSTATPVVLHARRPERSDMEDDRELLRERYRSAPDPEAHSWDFEHDPWSFPDSSTREVSMRSGSSVPLTGVSWGPVGYHYTRDTSQGGYADVRHDPRYRHLDFPEGLSARASATYGRPEDARDGEYNGGMNDTGMYWAEPGQQQWAEENQGPQEEAPPPPWAVPPVLARLAQIEEACQVFGGTLRHATTINGTPVDDHGDAPAHGLVPRASDPDSYDARSTEGDGDPKWDDPVDTASKKEFNGATVGMFPEGVSSGNGPGLPIGPFTAGVAQGASRVPWTGKERGTLHSWQDVPTGTAGDWVPRGEFTGRGDGTVPADEAAQDELRASGAAQPPRVPGTGPAVVPPVPRPGRHETVTNFLTSLVDLLGHGHDDPENSLDYGNDPVTSGNVRPDIAGQPDNSGDNGNMQASGPGRPGSSGDVRQWPLATALVTETGPAWTQGRDDGKRSRPSPLTAEAALAMYEGAAASASFRFEFTAGWHDVVAKAKRIRDGGHVRITHASPGIVVGEVRGDHDTYESGIQRPPGRPQAIRHWACGCPWASFHQDGSVAARYAGRPCSHVMALQFEAQSRGMFGKEVARDEQVPAWSRGDVTVKSWPPYEGDPHRGHWSEYWTAPAVQATAALVRAGEDPDDLAALARLGRFSSLARTAVALTRLADQANGPWGSEGVSESPPVKPYGATEKPNREQDPGSYGFLSDADPDNWGEIQDGSYLQSPLSNQAARVLPPDLHYPDVGDWHEDQEGFGYADRAGTAGPSTSISPRDPQGIRMEEARRDCPCCGGTGEHDTGRECYGCDASGSSDGYSGGIPCDGTRPYGTDDHGHQVELHPVDGWQHLDGSVSHDDGTSVTDGPVTAELHDQPEAALPSTTGDEQQEGEELRGQAGIDGTMGDAQDVPHQFTASVLHGGCALCGLDPVAPPHIRVQGCSACADGSDEMDRARGTCHNCGRPVTASGSVQDRSGAYQAVRDRFRSSGGMGDLGRESFPQAQQPSVVTQQPGMGSMDEELTPDDQSIQTIGNQQWSGGGTDSDEGDVPAGEPQGGMDDIVASFQRSAAARQYGQGGAGGASDSDIAGAARQYLSRTAEVLPDAEAAELIAEGRGQRARNLGLLRLEGTHYEDEDDALARRGLSLDDYDDDVVSA